jgi:uncharacterized membrane-anchored protein
MANYIRLWSVCPSAYSGLAASGLVARLRDLVWQPVQCACSGLVALVLALVWEQVCTLCMVALLWIGIILRRPD